MNIDQRVKVTMLKDQSAVEVGGIIIGRREEPTVKKNNYYAYYKQGYDFGVTLWNEKD